MKRLFSSFALSIIMLFSPAVLTKKLDTVASFSVLADIIHQVGGEHVNVIQLVGPGNDLHAFEPTPKDSQVLAKADLVFINGIGLDSWIEKLITASCYHGKVIIASEGIKIRKMINHGKIVNDPHVWNNIHNGAIYARNVMNALIAADAQDALYFRHKGTAYINKLEKLHRWTQQQFIDIPQVRRKVLTSHNSFGYFSAAYNVSFLSPSTEGEASAYDIARLINQIKTEKVSTYFIDNHTNTQLVKQIANASGAKIGGELFPETLSIAGGPATTYEAAFRYNVNTLANSIRYTSAPATN